MTSVSASGGRSPVRLCRIVPQTNDPPAWLKAGRAFSFLAALTPRPLRRSIVTVRIPRPSSPLGFRSTGFGASVIVFPVIALQGRQIAFERPCRHPRTSRRELSGEVRNCHLKPSNRSSDSLNDLLNSSSGSPDRRRGRARACSPSRPGRGRCSRAPSWTGRGGSGRACGLPRMPCTSRGVP